MCPWFERRCWLLPLLLCLTRCTGARASDDVPTRPVVRAAGRPHAPAAVRVEPTAGGWSPDQVVADQVDPSEPVAGGQATSESSAEAAEAQVVCRAPLGSVRRDVPGGATAAATTTPTASTTSTTASASSAATGAEIDFSDRG